VRKQWTYVVEHLGVFGIGIDQSMKSTTYSCVLLNVSLNGRRHLVGLTSAYSETCLSHERLKREKCHQFLQLLATGSSGRVNVRPTRTEEARSIAKRTSHVLVMLRSSRSCWSLTTFVTEGRLRFRSTATLEDSKKGGDGARE